MGWIGKIVGGALGLAIGGPLGLVAGIAFGNLFDRSTNIGRTQKAPTYTQTQHSQMVYFVATFSMLAKMATANGRFVPEERKVIEDYMTHKLKLDPSSKEAAWRVFNAALSGQGTFEEYAQQFYESFAHERAHLEVMLDVLVGIAAADGKIDPSEERLINRAASIFRISASLLDAIKKRYTNNLDDAYALLGLTRQASEGDIKRAYRRLSIDYHPDSIASKGLPEEFTLFASEKFRSIQEAYEAIKKERGFT
ncbi:MAG: TerB family tellurite resistance protein [Sphaerochaetaceae bacterium]